MGRRSWPEALACAASPRTASQLSARWAPRALRSSPNNGENSFSSSVSFSDVHSYVRAAHDVMEHIMRHYMKLTVESAKETTPGVNV
jgi:hypothetical protein